MSANLGFIVVALFLLFLAGLLFVSMWASPDLRLGDTFFTEEADHNWLRTGLAYAGDFAPAASTLYLIGIVAMGGTDGVILCAGAALSPVLLAVFLSKRLPLGARSVGDMIAVKLPGPEARRVMAVAAMVPMGPLLVGQLIPMGEFLAQTIALSGTAAERVCIAVMGVLMVSCAAIGATRGTTLLQVVKSASLFVVVPVLIFAIMSNFDWDFGLLIETADAKHGSNSRYLELGGLFGGGINGKVELLSWSLGGLLGAAFVPYMLTRLSTAKDSAAARRAAGFGAGMAVGLCSVAVLLGFGVAALVDKSALTAAGPLGGNNVVLLASTLDGNSLQEPGIIWLVVSCAAVSLVLGSIAVLLLSGAAALSRDLGLHRVRHRRLRPFTGPRSILIMLGGLGIAAAMIGSEVNMALWVTSGYSLAASSLAPALIYSLAARPFPLAALRRCVYAGLASNLIVTVFSESFSSAPDSIFPEYDFCLIPLHTPGLISVPLAFLLGAIRLPGDTPPPPSPEESKVGIEPLPPENFFASQGRPSQQPGSYPGVSQRDWVR